MKPQRKPFVVEIRKAKQIRRKPASSATNPAEPATRADVRAALSQAVQSGAHA